MPSADFAEALKQPPGRMYNDFATKGIASFLDPAIFDYESRTRRRLRPNSAAETLLSATPKRSRGNTKTRWIAARQAKQ
jgi:hypothetical protein